MSFLKPISISLSPNTEKDDVWLAFKLLFQPWRWKKGKEIEKLESEFKEYLGAKYALSFNSGRSALMAILGALDVKEGDEVILQAFTCNSAVNPILGRKAKPVFVDVDDTLNLDPKDLERKITSRTKAVMVQHNFGWPARMEEIMSIVKEKNVHLIEDCAHSLGAKYQGKFCGTFGDAAFFSLGRDKIISSVFGGVAVTNNSRTAEKMEDFRKRLNYPSRAWIFQQLLHPVLMDLKVMPAYALHPYWGRMLLGAYHKLSVLSKAVYKEEKEGKISKNFPKLLPGAFAALALNQFRKLEKFNNHRREIATFYGKRLNGFKLPLSGAWEGMEPVFMRYPVLVERNTDEILKEARKKKIFLDDGWRKSPVVPPDTDIEKIGYALGSCPGAEKVAQSIVNLPTHINISEENAQKIVSFLNKWKS